MLLLGDFTDVFSRMTTLDDNFSRNLAKMFERTWSQLEARYSMKSYVLHEITGVGEANPEKLGEGEFLKGLCQFQTKICNFLPPFSYLTQNAMPCFRHGASKNYSVPIKHTQFTPKCTNYTLYLQIKTAKIYIVVQTKTAENHTLWCCAYLCGP